MSDVLLGIDPGVRGVGAALFIDGVLNKAAYVNNAMLSGNHVAECVELARAVKAWLPLDPNVIVFEWPRAYMPGKQSGDQNDLLALPGVDCAIAALLHRAKHITVFPDAWKGGNIDKEIMCRRIWERLSVIEKSRVERTPRGGGLKFDGVDGGFRHDVLDACGIAMSQIPGRLDRRRVFA